MDIKLIKEEMYKDFNIRVGAKFIKNYYDYYEKETDAVRLYYRIINPKGEEIFINKDYQYETVAREKVKRLLFWNIKPAQTFKEQVEERVNDIVHFVKKRIDKRLFEKEMTDGLLESLNEM